MKYHALQLQPMQESGAALLRAMQNESMIRLDLLVRESIQNAIDAANNGPGEEVRVDFLIRTHATETIASLLSDGLDGKKLRDRFPNGGRLLEIRDSLTEGLSGPMALDEIIEGESHGNLLKLVYEIGRTRINEGAGGSWGLGKTCYFRMGIGLIFYYSRIAIGDNFQERLVASLVEDESSFDKLQIESRTGIAWWGADGMKPITGSSQVKNVLDRMGIRRFTEEETGTAIVIPFLRDDLIPLSDVSATDDEIPKTGIQPWWYRSYDGYLAVAIQRWFCARVDNPLFATGPWLSVSVNGIRIRREKMLPIFQVAQSLYNRAGQSTVPMDDYFLRNGVDASALVTEAISLKSVFHSPGPAGKISGALLSAAQLRMDAPDNNPDPFLCLFGRAESTPPFRPIVTFMRKPGMSIRWEDSTESRAWSGGLTGSSDGRYLIAVFVPEQGRALSNELRRSLKSPKATLESYLRSCEKADHSQWHDFAGLSIATRIRTNVGNRLREFGSIPNRKSSISPAIRLARNLADLLLPQRGMGLDGRNGVGSPRPKGGRNASGQTNGNKTTRYPYIEIGSLAYQANGIRIGWTFNWGKGHGNFSRAIALSVDSENGPISPDEWRESGLGAFPFEMTEVSLASDGSTIKLDELLLIKQPYDGKVELVPIAFSLDDAELHGIMTIVFKSASAQSLRPLVRAVLIDTPGEFV